MLITFIVHMLYLGYMIDNQIEVPILIIPSKKLADPPADAGENKKMEIRLQWI